MDSDNVLGTDGLEVAHQNGSFVHIPGPGEDFVVADDVNVANGLSNETTASNGNAKVVVKLDDGLSNNLSTGEAEEENHAESNGLTIAEVVVLGLCSWFSDYLIPIPIPSCDCITGRGTKRL